MTTSVYKLNWPGLGDLPVFVIDPVTSDVYTSSSPLPVYKRTLDIPPNRYVRMTDVLKFFDAEQKEETEMIISSLQRKFCVQKAMVLKTPVESNDSAVTNHNDSHGSTYLPVYLLLALCTVWPCCAAFQIARDKLVESLDLNPEMICRHCGFVNPDCTCKRTGKENAVSCVGYAVSVNEKAVQVDLMSPSKQQSSNVSVVSSSSNPSGITFSTPSTNNLKLIAVPAFPLTSSGQQLSLPVSVVPLSFSLAEPNVSQGTILTLPMPTSVKSGVSMCPLASSLLNPKGTTPVITMSPSQMQPAATAALQQLSLTPSVSRNETNSLINSSSSPSITQLSLLRSNDQSSNQSPVSVNFFRPPKQTNSSFTGVKQPDQTEKQSEAAVQNNISVYKIALDGYVANKNSLKKSGHSEECVESSNSTTADEANKKAKPGDSSDSDKGKSSEKSESARKPGSPRTPNTTSDNKMVHTEHSNNADVDDEYSSAIVRKTTDQNSLESLDDKDLALKKAPKMWRQLDSDSDEDYDDNDLTNTLVSSLESTTLPENASDLVTDSAERNSVNVSKSSLSNSHSSATSQNDSQASCAADSVEDKDSCSVPCGAKVGASLEAVEGDEHKDSNLGIDSVRDCRADGSVTALNQLSSHDKDNEAASDVTTTNNPASSERVADAETVNGEVSASTDVVGGCNSNKTSAVAKPCRLYGKFEYIPTGEQIYKCTVAKCGQCFEGKQAAKLHSRSHYPQNDSSTSLRCPECEEMTVPIFHWFDLLRHLRFKHDVMISRLANTCDYCGLTFENEEQQISHMDYHYSNRYKCIHCGLLMLTWNQVKHHLESCSDKSKISLNLGCPYCVFVFSKRTLRNLHLLSHTDTGLVCVVCDNGVIWPDWKLLRKHYQQKHAKILQAKIGPFHSTLPIKRKPPPCSVCGVQYKTYEQFNAHMIRMHVYVPYVLVECTVCLRQYRSEKSHDWHVRHAHGEEIPCDKCNYVATSKANLKAHVTENHQAKQHTCTECDKSFNLYSQLRVHMAHHARRSIHSCQHCEEEFKLATDLRQHVQQEHASFAEASKKETHGCPECDYTCKSRLTLKVHVSSNHPELLESSLLLNSQTPEEGVSDSERNNRDDDEDDEETDDAFEDEEGEHLYCRSTPSTSSHGEGPSKGSVNQSGSGKRDRKRKFNGDEWVETDWADNEGEGRRERKRLKRLEKELEDNIRRLQKTSCARTRPVTDHHSVKRQRRSIAGEDSIISKYAQHEWPQRLLSAPSAASAVEEDVDISVVGNAQVHKPVTFNPEVWTRYPMKEHDYCKIVLPEPSTTVSEQKWESSVVGRETLKDSSFARTPGVSAFQECQTMSGLGNLEPSSQSVDMTCVTDNRNATRQQRFSSVFESVLSVQASRAPHAKAEMSRHASHSNSDSDSRRGQKSAFRGSSRTSKHSAQNLSQSELASFESTLQNIGMGMAGEAELLKSGNDYNLLQDILGSSVDQHANTVLPGMTRESVRLVSTGSVTDRTGIRSRSLEAGNHFSNRPYQSFVNKVDRNVRAERSTSGADYSNTVSSRMEDSNLLDSLPATLNPDGDLSQPTDLDDIELCEDDYNLWQGIGDPKDVKASALNSQQHESQVHDGRTGNCSQGVPGGVGLSDFVPASVNRLSYEGSAYQAVIDTGTCGLDLLSTVTATFGHDRVVHRPGENPATYNLSSHGKVNQNGTR